MYKITMSLSGGKFQHTTIMTMVKYNNVEKKQLYWQDGLNMALQSWREQPTNQTYAIINNIDIEFDIRIEQI